MNKVNSIYITLKMEGGLSLSHKHAEKKYGIDFKNLFQLPEKLAGKKESNNRIIYVSFKNGLQLKVGKISCDKLFSLNQKQISEEINNLINDNVYSSPLETLSEDNEMPEFESEEEFSDLRKKTPKEGESQYMMYHLAINNGLRTEEKAR